MSTLRDRLKAVTAPTLSISLRTWYANLDADDQKVSWEAIVDDTYKTYTLFKIFRETGLRAGKDTFVAFRNGVLKGTYTRDDLNGA